MYNASGQTRIPFTRVEQPHITGLSPNALRVYATTRSFANGHGKVTQVYQDQMAERAGLSQTHYRRGLREAEKAGAVVLDRDYSSNDTTYTFPKSGARFAAIPNPVLVRALQDLRARDFQVLVTLYLHVDTRTGITWISPSAIADHLGMTRSGASRSLRNLQDLRIVGVCSATECDSRKRHWHLPTHKTLTVTYTDHAPTIGGNNSYQGGTKVSKDELPQEDVRIVGREDHRQGKGRPRSRTLRAQRGDDLSPQGAEIWGATEPEPVAKQTILAKELLAAIASIKPGIVWKGPDYSMMTKWFNERLDHGWTEETCRRAIRMFIEDPGTVLAIGEKRPTVAFMGFVRRREAQFSETVTQQLREVTARMPEAYRRTQEARRQALERAERRGDRT